MLWGDYMLILIGPSASGKTEVAKLLSSRHNITKIVTYTTRKPRIHEVNGVDYNFVSVDEFAMLTSENFFVETTFYNSNYYGTARKDIQDNKCIILDPNGLKSFLALNDDRIVSIYLSCSEEVRYQRMINRKDSIESAKKRLVNDKITFTDANLQGINFVIDSDDISLDDLCEKVKELYLGVLKKL